MSQQLALLTADVLLSLAAYPVVLKFAGGGMAVCAVLCVDEGTARRTLEQLESAHWELISIRRLHE